MQYEQLESKRWACPPWLKLAKKLDLSDGTLLCAVEACYQVR
jgi:hypothetical protein